MCSMLNANRRQPPRPNRAQNATLRHAILRRRCAGRADGAYRHAHTHIANFIVHIMICFVSKQGLILMNHRLTRHFCCATLTAPNISPTTDPKGLQTS